MLLLLYLPPHRLYARAIFQGFRRSRVNQYSDHARLRVEGLNARSDVKSYLGKRVVHVYKSGKGYKVSCYGYTYDTYDTYDTITWYC